MGIEIKYDEAAYFTDNLNFTLVKIEDLINLYTKEPIKYKREYHGRLFCPVCHKPQLTLAYIAKTNNHYLKGFPKQSHSDNCSKMFEYVDTKVLNNIILDDEFIHFIKPKLEKMILNRFFKNEEEHIQLIKIDGEKIVFDELKKEEIITKKNIRQIPSKSLTAPFYDEDFDNYKLFYGNVDISLTKKTNRNTKENFYVMYFIKKNTNCKICSLSMSENVAKHLIELYDVELDKVFYNTYVSFWTKIKRNGNYKNGNIIHSDLCVIITQ